MAVDDEFRCRSPLSHAEMAKRLTIAREIFPNNRFDAVWVDEEVAMATGSDAATAEATSCSDDDESSNAGDSMMVEVSILSSSDDDA